MPTSAEIVRGLTRISHEATLVAIGWHLVAAFSIMLVFAGLRLQRRTAALLLSLPLLSVGALALAFNNRLDCAFFALLALALAALASRAEPGLVTLGPPWAVALGSLLIAFGWGYPHFVAARSSLTYFYAAPLGAIPAPTLAFLTGVALVSGGFRLHGWCLTLALAAGSYSLWAVFHLGIRLDLALLFGGLGLAALRLQQRRSRPEVRAG